MTDGSIPVRIEDWIEVDLYITEPDSDDPTPKKSGTGFIPESERKELPATKPWSSVFDPGEVPEPGSTPEEQRSRIMYDRLQPKSCALCGTKLGCWASTVFCPNCGIVLCRVSPLVRLGADWKWVIHPDWREKLLRLWELLGKRENQPYLVYVCHADEPDETAKYLGPYSAEEAERVLKELEGGDPDHFWFYEMLELDDDGGDVQRHILGLEA